MREPKMRPASRARIRPWSLCMTAAALVLSLVVQPASAYCESGEGGMNYNTKLCRESCHLIGGVAEPRFYQWEE